MQGVETVSTSSQTLQDEPSIEEFFNVVATETLALFEYLEFEFLTDLEHVVDEVFDCLDRAKDPDCSRVHREQISLRGDGDARHT